MSTTRIQLVARPKDDPITLDVDGRIIRLRPGDTLLLDLPMPGYRDIRNAIEALQALEQLADATVEKAKP